MEEYFVADRSDVSSNDKVDRLIHAIDDESSFCLDSVEHELHPDTANNDTTGKNHDGFSPAPIQPSSLPINSMQRKEESSFSDSMDIVRAPMTSSPSPRPIDVICARGRGHWNHPGNKYFRFIIANHSEAYGTATCNSSKTSIVKNIVSLLRENGARVVKPNGSSVDDNAIIGKIAQSLRDSQQRNPRAAKKAKRSRHEQKYREKQDAQFPSIIERFKKHGARDLDDLEIMVHSSHHVANFMSQVSHDLQSLSATRSNEEAYETMLKANKYLLEVMKVVKGLGEASPSRSSSGT